MIRPASTFPDKISFSISENSTSTLLEYSGFEILKSKFAVVYFPWIAILLFEVKATLGFLISSGPQFLPRADQLSSKTYSEIHLVKALKDNFVTSNLA